MYLDTFCHLQRAILRLRKGEATSIRYSTAHSMLTQITSLADSVDPEKQVYNFTYGDVVAFMIELAEKWNCELFTEDHTATPRKRKPVTEDRFTLRKL